MAVPLLRSLRTRLIASVVLIEIVMLSLLVWNNMSLIRQAHADRLRDTAASMLQQIASTAGSYLVEVDYARLEEYLGNIAGHPELAYLAVLDGDQRPVVRFGELPVGGWPEADRHPAAVDDGRYDRVAEIRFAGRGMGQVRMGFSLARMEQAIQAARMRSVAIAGGEIVLTVLATVLLGLGLTHRLGQLAAAAQRVGAGDYGVTVPTGVKDEVGMTAAAFNRMVAEVSQRTCRLQEALARERVIEQTAIDGMITYDASGRILSVNPAMEALFGYRGQELLGRNVALLLEAEAGAALWNRATGRRQELQGRRRDGSRFPLELYIGQVDVRGEPLYAATLHDITERKRAENECRTLLQGNRFLIHKSLAVQEEERRHLARELHDELGQCTTAIQADAELIHERAQGGDGQVAASAAAIIGVSARMYDVVHSMMRRLRPTVLDDLGLVAALEEAVQDWRQRQPEIGLEFTSRGELGDLGEAVNISLYRIVQEGLTNIARHAGARRVGIRLSRELEAGRSLVRLEIEDDGCGMEPQATGQGLGLIGMRERVEALHGSLELVSSPAAGTAIRVRIPLTEEEGDRGHG
ncbi:PAS domain S-box protein [Thiohalobacter sp. IOR34]|uniref:PAS domain S-box protein n=1 Tax=Thiohalobacter sp. IOR34 TaxID=3057176 RepID=UPI0025B09CD7|nr:PAS domain S-box protein [Thiohalobacter sp. IOR34]WJW75738.1 PAS domain S-box protein [Thiohalobacter sp. IOR34]